MSSLLTITVNLTMKVLASLLTYKQYFTHNV
jgi:hypothetical protein